jgi:hypothetical protein
MLPKCGFLGGIGCFVCSIACFACANAPHPPVRLELEADDIEEFINELKETKTAALTAKHENQLRQLWRDHSKNYVKPKPKPKPKPYKYDKQLAQILSMGFSDISKIKRVLDLYKGKTQQSVLALMT